MEFPLLTPTADEAVADIYILTPCWTYCGARAVSEITRDKH